MTDIASYRAMTLVLALGGLWVTLCFFTGEHMETVVRKWKRYRWKQWPGQYIM